MNETILFFDSLKGAEALEAALREVAPFNSGPLRLGVLQVGALPGCMHTLSGVGSYRGREIALSRRCRPERQLLLGNAADELQVMTGHMGSTGSDCRQPAAQRVFSVACSCNWSAFTMQGSLEDKYQTLQAQLTKTAVDNVPETDADGKPLTKKARAALIRAAEQVATDATACCCATAKSPSWVDPE
jgi:hypothetical protein